VLCGVKQYLDKTDIAVCISSSLSMSELLSSHTAEGYDIEVVRSVWSLAQVIPGNDPEVWRKDEFGAWINRADYRNRHSDYGWEIADYGYSRRSMGLASLRPMQWLNYLDFMVAARNQAVVTADGLRNTRRLL
jgi:hypothetical protein